MAFRRTLAMDGTRGHVKSSTATAAEETSTLKDSGESLSEGDDETLKVFGFSNASTEKVKHMLRESSA